MIRVLVLLLPLVASAHPTIEGRLAIANRAVELNPERAEGFLIRGALYSFHGDNELAERDFEAATARKDSVEVRLVVAEHLLRTDRLDKAREMFEQIVQQDPGLARAWLGLAKVASAEAHYARSIESYRSYFRIAVKPEPGYFVGAVQVAAKHDVVAAREFVTLGIETLGPVPALVRLLESL